MAIGIIGLWILLGWQALVVLTIMIIIAGAIAVYKVGTYERPVYTHNYTSKSESRPSPKKPNNLSIADKDALENEPIYFKE